MAKGWLARPPCVIRQAQDEEIGDCMGVDGIKDFLMLSLPGFAEATPDLMNQFVRRSLGEGGSKHARC
jgi:hypothetical protein